jgi:murein DD-endopeptidase MepM/ murein hydrolase activator NlpD
MKFILARLARLRLQTVLLLHRLSKRVRGASLSRLVRSRRALIAVYMLAIIALAGAWWWDSPERFLGQRPPFTPPDRTAPPVVNPPLVDPVTQPATDPVAEPPKEVEQKPPEQPAPAAQPTTPAVPAIAAPVTVNIDTLHRPVAGEIIKQYGFRWSATHQDFRYHLGIGIAASPGSTVVAAYAGRIKSVETNHPEWGTLVVVDHGGGWRTEYASLTAPAVRVGQIVTAGQKLGQLGPNPPARSADATQLYFALFKDDESHDPAPKMR